MHIEAARNFSKDQVFALALRLQNVLADDGTDGRIAVLGGDIDEPALHRIKPCRRNANGCTVAHAEEEGAAVRIGEGHHLASHRLGVWRVYAAVG